jgi:Fe-S oxidoreductase
MVTDIMVNSFEFYLHPELFENPELSYVAYGFSELWAEIGMSQSTAEALNTFFWYAHLIDFLAFLAFLPYSKHSHVLVVVPQIFLRRNEPTGVMQPIKNIEEAETFGAGKLTDFNWKQLLDPFNCTECGRCTEVCPANITGKLLSPKQYIVDVRHMLDAEIPPARFWMKKEGATNGNGENPIPMTTTDAVGFEQTWDCVTCGACMEACPVFIEHVPTIMDVRRFMVMEQSNMPETAQATLMQLEQRGHPWRGTQLTRTTWIEEMAAEGTEVPIFDGSQEYLYWVGCSGALQERNVKVTKALVRLFMQSGVSFGVLATEEGCSGDPARRLGNEYLYQMQAQQNIELMNAKGVQKVIANCPHCYNTIKHEYPHFEGTYETVHHTELLAELVRSGKLTSQQANGLEDKTVTYHDPCYTSRHNDIIDEPREVIAAVGSNTVEMPRCKRGTFCCGAGGGHMWVEENRGEHINDVRTKEAVDTGADVIAVACPFCMQMFESGVGSVPAAEERGVQVFDIAELLDMSVAYSKPLAPKSNGAPPSAPEPVVASEAPAEGDTPESADETSA